MSHMPVGLVHGALLTMKLVCQMHFYKRSLSYELCTIWNLTLPYKISHCTC